MSNIPIIPTDAPDSLLAGIYAAAEILLKLANAEGTPPRQEFDTRLHASSLEISEVLAAASGILLNIEGRQKAKL